MFSILVMDKGRLQYPGLQLRVPGNLQAARRPLLLR
jgi:hypothetical protein